MELNRFEDGLYSKREVASYLDIPPATLGRWAGSPHLVTTVANRGWGASVPFVGLAEAYTLKAFRAAGVSLQRIRPALAALDAEFGLGYALASQRLFTDGAEVLFDYATHSDSEDDIRDLVIVRRSQPVFADVVEDYLKRVQFRDSYASVIPVLGFADAGLVVDVSRGFGQPVFEDGGARLSDVVSLFTAGESLDVVSEEFGLPRQRIEAALRGSLRLAA